MFGTVPLGTAPFADIPEVIEVVSDYDAFLDDVDGEDVFLVELTAYQMTAET